MSNKLVKSAFVPKETLLDLHVFFGKEGAEQVLRRELSRHGFMVEEILAKNLPEIGFGLLETSVIELSSGETFKSILSRVNETTEFGLEEQNNNSNRKKSNTNGNGR